ncbi:MAG: XRE family transcriptional regulator [Fusobacteriaceae bacterium]
MRTTGDILKEKRLKKNYSADRLAEELEVSQPYVTSIENNKKNPSKNFLKNVYKFLEFTQSEIDEINVYEEFRRLPEKIQKELVRLKRQKLKSGTGNTKILIEDDFVEMPVKAKASAGNGYLNFEDTLYTKLIRRGNFCQDCYLIEVAGNSMEPLIQDGSFVIVDPHQVEYTANKIFIVKVGEETFVKRILIKEEAEVMILKSINPDYEDVYIAGKELSNVKLLGRAIKFVYEGNL